MMDEKINEVLWSEAEKVAEQPYKVEISESVLTTGEKVYILKNLELDCIAQGATLEEASKELKEVQVTFIYYMLVDGLDIPKPLEQVSKS